MREAKTNTVFCLRVCQTKRLCSNTINNGHARLHIHLRMIFHFIYLFLFIYLFIDLFDKSLWIKLLCDKKLAP